MTTFTGSISVVAAGDKTGVSTKLGTHSDALKALSEAWSTYGSTASFTATSSNPSGGTWTGHYLRVNKLVMFWVRIVQGSTVGSGTYKIALPVAPVTNYPAHFDVFITDTSASARYRGVTYDLSGSTVSLAYDANGSANASLNALTNAAPFTMASGDVIEIHGTYEAA